MEPRMTLDHPFPPAPRRALLAASLLPAAAGLLLPRAARAANAAELTSASQRAMDRFIGHNEHNRKLIDDATATLTFPEIVKGGLIVGGEFGDGVLRKGETVAGFYRLVAASVGLQIGGQTFSMIMLFMNEKALEYLDHSDGWQVGTAPNLVIADEKFARDYSSTSARRDVVVFVFGQRGLMAGIDIKGAKISRHTPG
jgi:lipid-binding SYLF domain-containing protein